MYSCGYNGIFGVNCLLLSQKLFESIVNSIDGIKEEQIELIQHLIIEIEEAKNGLNEITIEYSVTPNSLVTLCEQFGYSDENKLFKDYRQFKKYKKFSTDSHNASLVYEKQLEICKACDEAAKKFGRVVHKNITLEIDVLSYNVIRLLKNRVSVHSIDMKLAFLNEKLKESDIKSLSKLGIPLYNLCATVGARKEIYGYDQASICKQGIDMYRKSFCWSGALDSGSLEDSLVTFHDLEDVYELTSKKTVGATNVVSVSSIFDKFFYLFESKSILKYIQDDLGVALEPKIENFYYTSKLLSLLGVVGFNVVARNFSEDNRLKPKSVREVVEFIIPVDSLMYTCADLMYIDKMSKLHFTREGGLIET